LTQLKSNPSPKRAYGQVQRIAEDQWRCPDGKTFPRAYLAYRHLKELKEKNPNLLSPYKSPRTSTAERRAMQQRVVTSAVYSAGASPADSMDMTFLGAGEAKRCVVELFGSKVDAETMSKEVSLYHTCRMWRLNDPFGRTKPTAYVDNSNGIELPPPLPHTAESLAQDYRDGQHEVQDLDSVIMSTPDTPPELLLESHKTFAKAIRNWWQTRRIHRINRYKKGRLDVLLPDFAERSETPDRTEHDEISTGVAMSATDKKPEVETKIEKIASATDSVPPAKRQKTEA